MNRRLAGPVFLTMFLVTSVLAMAGAPPKEDQISVAVGHTFLITLAANPTTGYRWRLADELPDHLLELVGSQYQSDQPADGRPGLVGVGGREVWQFKAIGPGKTTIHFKYIRPWEKDIPPVERRSFFVNIAK